MVMTPARIARVKAFAACFHQDTRGTVAITFLLSLPILWMILLIITQYALLVNAKLAVNHALAMAARSAMTTFPSDPAVEDFNGVDYVNRTLRMQLATISPIAKVAATSESQSVLSALQAVGVAVGQSYSGHFTYAAAASNLTWQRLDSSGQAIAETTWQPANFAAATGQSVKMTVTYEFYLNIPIVKYFTGYDGNIAGIDGRFYTVTSSFTFTTSHGRATVADDSGWPQ